MEIEIFKNSDSYLSTLKEYHQKTNLFKHLENKNGKSVLDVIEELYMNDDYMKLFDPLYEELRWASNNEIGVMSCHFIISDYSDFELKRAWIFLVRTNSCYYNLIGGENSKEDNYKLTWFSENQISDEANLDNLMNLFYSMSNYDDYDESDYEESQIENHKDYVKNVWFERFSEDSFYQIVDSDIDLDESIEDEDDEEEEEEEETDE
jgi:hypothetical protein